MSYVREITEPPERRPIDIWRLVVCGVAVVLLGVWAETQSTVNVDLFASVNGLGANMLGVAETVYALGSIWAALVVVALLLVRRHWVLALRVGVAVVTAWGIGVLIGEILGMHTITGINVRLGDGPIFPSVNVAVVTALTFALSPFVVRSLRRLLAFVVVIVGFAALYLGAGLPSDVLGGVLLGMTTAAGVLVAFGSTAGKPTVDEVRAALVDLGYEPTDIRPSKESIARATVMDVDLPSGARYRVDVFGRDQRDAQVVAKWWHRLMYHEPGLPVFGTRIQQVEHVGYTMFIADRAGVRAPSVVKTGVGGPDAAVLVSDPRGGTPFGELATEQVTDDVLASLWSQIHKLHGVGISHNELDPLRILVADGEVAFDDFTAADATGQGFWMDCDVAAALVATAQRVGNDRAIAAAVAGLGKERVGAVLPVVQPSAVPAATKKGEKHFGKTLKELRNQAATATGAEEVKPLQIQRLSWANIGILAGVLLALAIAIPGLAGVDWNSVKGEFEHADWGWVLLAAVCYPLVPMAWGTALMGCVNKSLAYVPTALTQLAATFLNLITPNGIGGTALQLEYLHKQGVPPVSGASAMALSTGVGGLIQMSLFLIAASITATAVDTGDQSSDNTSLWVIALVAAAIGLILMIPKIRNKVVPAVKKAASDIWAVIRNPKKAMQLLGGDLAGNLLYPALLGFCLLAFHQHLDYAELVCVQIGAGMLGGVAPVPGGIGVTEAALTAGLTTFGIPATPALAAVLVFRGVTFAIPPIFGYFTLRYLRKQGYA
jgi:uncharacterized membrane protein YbhN (UPF0104 family)/membrane-associated phospholipid phosphatase/tRNA A-37 threonylcarbamoyl transferase component Bud32